MKELQQPSNFLAGADQDTVADLTRQLEQREFEIQLLCETADAVTSQLQLDRVLQIIAERARDLVRAESVLVPILSADCSEYTYQAGCGPHADEIVGETLPRTFGICGWVWDNRRAWWAGVIEEMPDNELNRWEQEAGSVIMVPMIGKQHFLGGIAAHNKVDGGDFNRRDLDILTLFATQACIAIENAMHYDVMEKAKLQAEHFQQELREVNDQLAKSNADLERLALFDAMTELPNRTLYTDRLQQALRAAAREGESVGVMMVDLDHFKEINDTLGHDVGDVMLIEVARRFQSVVREADTVGRLGGDEFALVLKDCQAYEADEMALRLQEVMEPHFNLAEGVVTVSASIGIALYPEHGEDVSTLLKHADIAMYAAKQERTGYAVYTAHADPHNPQRLAKRAALRQLIADKALEVHYQPKIALPGGEVVGVEALARWRHPEWGMVPPDEFIPMLEQAGLIRSLTGLVLDIALRQQQAWKRSGHDLSIAVNLSVHDIRDDQFNRRLATVLRQWDADPHRLILELTEGAVMDKRDATRRVMDAVTGLGVQFAIDDFGTGYSSLSRLKHLPMHELKIDRSFISHMDSDQDDVMIARSTIDLAHNLGLRVVAEGIENAAALAQLAQMGCDQVQGYFISKPIPGDAIVDFLRNDRPTPSSA